MAKDYIAVKKFRLTEVRDSPGTFNVFRNCIQFIDMEGLPKTTDITLWSEGLYCWWLSTSIRASERGLHTSHVFEICS